MSRDNMSKSYYLMSNPPSILKNLNNLKGWQEKVVQELLSDKDEENKKSSILALLSHDDGDNLPSSFSSRTHTEEASQINYVISFLAKPIRSRAKIFLHHVLKFVRVREDGSTEVEEEGGAVVTRSSPLIDIVRYYCSPPAMRVPLPLASEHLERAFLAHNVPQSAFARGRSPLPSSSNFMEPSQSSFVPKSVEKWISY